MFAGDLFHRLRLSRTACSGPFRSARLEYRSSIIRNPPLPTKTDDCPPDVRERSQKPRQCSARRGFLLAFPAHAPNPGGFSSSNRRDHQACPTVPRKGVPNRPKKITRGEMRSAAASDVTCVTSNLCDVERSKRAAEVVRCEYENDVWFAVRAFAKMQHVPAISCARLRCNDGTPRLKLCCADS
jgi:hypothetical protein